MSTVEAEVIREEETSQQLVPSISITNLLSVRDGILARMRNCYTQYQEASRMCEDNGFEDLGWIFDEHCSRGNVLEHDDFITKMSRRLDAKGWDHLMRESGLWSLMDAKARKDWYEKIQQKEVPELTHANIEATFQQLFTSRGDIFDRGVINVFKSLSWDYKTNSPFRFGKRIIVTWLTNPVTRREDGPVGYPNTRQTDQIDDLLRVFHVLDGKPEPDHRQGAYQLISHARCNRETVADCDYLTIRMHKNGNGHVMFKRLDMVECMNRIIAKHYPGVLPAQN